MKSLIPTMIALFVIGCGGAATDDATEQESTNTQSGNDGTSVAASSDVVGAVATMNKMLAKNETVSETSIAGTWVAAWSIASERSDIVAAPRIEQYPDLQVNRVEFVVIRPAEEEGQFEMASCNGNGFESVAATADKITTASRETLILESNKSMVMSYSTGPEKVVVPRLNESFDYEPSFVEKQTVNARYIKVSDSYDALGQFTQDWRPTTLSPTDPSHAEITKNLYCTQLDHVTNAGLYTLRLGSDDAMKLHVTGSDYNPVEPMAYVSEPTYEGPLSGLIDTGAEACKANLDLYHSGEDGRIAGRFLIQKDGGDLNAVSDQEFDINIQ